VVILLPKSGPNTGLCLFFEKPDMTSHVRFWRGKKEKLKERKKGEGKKGRGEMNKHIKKKRVLADREWRTATTGLKLLRFPRARFFYTCDHLDELIYLHKVWAKVRE